MLQLQKPFQNVLLTVFSLLCIGFQNANAQQMPALAPNFLSLPQKDYEIPLQWMGDSVNGRWEPHAALLLPVKLPGCSKQFYMQFYLGAPSTLFYRSKLQQIHAKYPKTIATADTAIMLANFHFTTGKMPVVAKEATIIDYRNPKINWADKKSMEIIGTIGADFIENRVVVFDYPGKKLFNGTSMPKKVAEKVKLTDFMLAGRTVLLPAVIQGKKSLIYFDTGSSAYQLLIDKKTAETLASPGVLPEQHAVRSWDRMLTANTFATNDSIEMAAQKLPLVNVTYMEGASNTQIAQMMKMGIGGMTGNKLFIHSVLVLDTKNKKFGLLRK